MRHEFPFSTNHVHRGAKYRLAVEHGARAFLIGHNQPGPGPISGSSGSGTDTDIPAYGLSSDATLEFAAALTSGPAQVMLHNEGARQRWAGTNLLAPLPRPDVRHLAAVKRAAAARRHAD